MALGPKPFTATVTLTTTAATTVVSSPITGVNRYIRHIKVNNAGAIATFTLGLKATTTAPAAGDAGLIALSKSVPANDSVDMFFTGDGLEWKAASALNLNGSSNTATQVTVDVIGVEVVA